MNHTFLTGSLPYRQDCMECRLRLRVDLVVRLTLAAPELDERVVGAILFELQKSNGPHVSALVLFVAVIALPVRVVAHCCPSRSRSARARSQCRTVPASLSTCPDVYQSERRTLSAASSSASALTSASVGAGCHPASRTTARRFRASSVADSSEYPPYHSCNVRATASTACLSSFMPPPPSITAPLAVGRRTVPTNQRRGHMDQRHQFHYPIQG